MNDFYKHYLYFYSAEVGLVYEIIANKPMSLHKVMCDRLDINVCHTIGTYYGRLSYDNPGAIHSLGLKSIPECFEYLSGGDPNKLRYLYQGFTRDYFLKFFQRCSDNINDCLVLDYLNDRIKKAISEIEKINQKYQNFCYIGLGEGLFYIIKRRINLEQNKKMIEETTSFIGEDRRKYFFQGWGEGLAKMSYAFAYSPYIMGHNREYLKYYLNKINKREYRDAFLFGFFNKDIWRQY